MFAMNYDAVIRHFGTRYKLAQALGIGISAAYTWPKGTIPVRHHARIAELMAEWPQAAQDRSGDTNGTTPSDTSP